MWHVTLVNTRTSNLPPQLASHVCLADKLLSLSVLTSRAWSVNCCSLSSIDNYLILVCLPWISSKREAGVRAWHLKLSSVRNSGAVQRTSLEGTVMDTARASMRNARPATRIRPSPSPHCGRNRLVIQFVAKVGMTVHA